MKKAFLFCAFLFVLLSVSAQELIYPFMKQINKGQYEKAEEKINKALLKKDNCENNFAAYKLFSDERFSKYCIEKAYSYLLNSENKMEGLDEKSYQKLSKNGLTRQQLYIELKQTSAKGLEYAEKNPSIESYNNFLTFYSKAPSNQVNKAITNRDIIAYSKAVEINTVSAFQNFIEEYPQANQVPEAWQNIFIIEFQKAKEINSENAYRNYAKKYPQSPFSNEAVELANNIQFAGETTDGDWESFSQYITNHKNQPEQIKLAKHKIWEIAKSSDEIEPYKYCAKYANDPVRDSALLYVHDYYLNSGIENIDSFYDEFDYSSETFKKIKNHDLKVKEAYAKIDATDIESIENFISITAPYREAYLLLLALANKDIKNKNWEGALETVLLFEDKFGDDSNYKILLNTLLSDDEKSINITPFPKTINSKDGNEYAIAVSADDKNIYFCGRDRKDNIGGEDIFYSQKTKNGWADAKKISDLNTAIGNEAPLNISVDGTKMILFKSGQLCESNKTADGWSEPEFFSGNINISDWQADAMITGDGKAMIFAAKKKTNRELKASINIYVSELNENGEWKTPIELGPAINTPFDDRSPFLHPDMKTLYFCSEGHATLGGLDVFKSTRLSETSWTEWSEPENIGKEINTIGNDCWYKISTDGKTAYFSKSDAEGLQDLYWLNLPKHMRPNMVATISGQLKDKNNNPISAEIHWEDLETGKEIGQSKTDPATGNYYIVLPLGKIYGYYVNDENYFPISDNIDLREGEQAVAVENNIQIVSYKQMIDDGLAIPVNNLFFNTNEDKLLSYSLPELRRVSEIIKKNNLKVELSGHTDNVGDNASNQDLSERRAESVKHFLIENNCEEKLITTVGYGSTKPVATNNTPEGRQKNRRVELRFIK